MGASWSVLGYHEKFYGGSWGVLGASWEPLGASWECLGSLLGRLGGSWEALGRFLEPTWEIFGARKALVKHLGSDYVKF